MPRTKTPKKPFPPSGPRPVELSPPPHNLLFSSRQLLRDFKTLLDFDLNVLYYTPRPFPIPYTDDEGNRRIYTPAFFVQYRADIIPAKWMPPLLCEVRCRDDLARSWAALKPMLRAGLRYARERRWRFQIVTEREVRTPYLENARFLSPYREKETDWQHTDLLLDTLYELRLATPEVLLAACAADESERAELLPSLWEMVAKKRLGVDLTQPLTMRSDIWSYDV